ncbi:MAG: phosphate ABC transporter substrate-binding protein PstS [Myxococcales bacterium]
MSTRAVQLVCCLALLAWLVLGCTPDPKVVQIHGAGASFPAPLYDSWIKSFYQAHPNVLIDYQSVGSGSGVKGVIDNTLDFGASDAAMTEEEMGRVAQGVQLFPMTAGSIVIAYNLPGVKKLNLSREAYTGIFLGRIKRWNDPAITAHNPDVALPESPINVVVRADSSGTTYVFTKHLSAVSPAFAEGPGTNKMPNWPVGTRSKGNEGVTASIELTPGSIGYVEYGYAKLEQLPMAALENHAGRFVAPDARSGQAALSDMTLPVNLIGWNTDPMADDAYPIVTYTWLILYREYADPKKLDALRSFVRYGLSQGQSQAASLGYVPLPAKVVKQVLEAVENVKLVAQR